MVEVIVPIAHWVQLIANLFLLGGCTFIVITNTDKPGYSQAWIKKMEQLFLWAAFIIPISLIVIFITMITQAAGLTGDSQQQKIWLEIIQDTQPGQIWAARFVSACLLFLSILFLAKSAAKKRWHYCFVAAIATLPLIAGSMASHIASAGLSASAVSLYALHLIFAGLWFGALPASLLLVQDRLKGRKLNKVKYRGIEALKLFSAIAFSVMLLLILTGMFVTDRLLDGRYVGLVATQYGWLLSGKIVLLSLILLIAASIKESRLSMLTDNKESIVIDQRRTGLQKWMRIQFWLAVVLIILSTWIANTTPAKYFHIDEWPLTFRFSIDATWNKPNVAWQVWTGLAVALISVLTMQFGRLRNWSLKRQIAIPGLMFVSAIALTLPPLAIEAYPETYRRPPVSFDVVSIANGAMVYERYCVECHGLQGMGNGIKSRTLSTKLPDLMIEPHIIEHTPGDFYNWITYGMKNTDMPGFAEKLSENERWDLINYIHALSRGYQARILSPEIVPDQAFAKPPLFSFNKHGGTINSLQEFRGRNHVLMVLFSWPQSQVRLEQLKMASKRLTEQQVAVIVVPVNELDSKELKEIADTLPFSVITQGAKEIVDSFMLWRRTVSHPDIIGRGSNPEHIEFLIDKNSYLRARWIPSRDQKGWSDIDVLVKQVEQLQQEQTKFPVPEEFVR